MTPTGNASHAAIVLAGGRSSRMGSPKALLPFGGAPLIVHIVDRLRALFAEVVVVAAPGQALPPVHAAIVHDDVSYQGPVAGIHYGLKAIGAEAAFVTSCDSAFLNADLVAHLVSRIAAFDVVVPQWGGRLQPLHAVYRRSVAPLLEAQLARGELRPVQLFDRVRTCRVEEEEIRRFDPDGWSFFNMNTPEDYAAALTHREELDRGGHGDAAGPVHCTVELFGVARLLSGTAEVPLALPAGATYSQAFAALARKLPALAGRVIARDGESLLEGFACSVNGLRFVRTPGAEVSSGDTLVILSADAGG